MTNRDFSREELILRAKSEQERLKAVIPTLEKKISVMSKEEIIEHLDYLGDLRNCLHEAKWISFNLKRRFVFPMWRDILLDSLTNKDLETELKDPKFAAWISSIYSSTYPPSFMEVVPPLTVLKLRGIRREIDRVSKRLYRSPHFSSEEFELSDAWDLNSADAKMDWQALLKILTNNEKSVLYLRYVESLTLIEIATQLGVSTTQAHRLVVNATRHARKFLCPKRDES